MNKSKLIGIGAGVTLLAIGAYSFEYYQYTGWGDERIDPYTVKAICNTSTYVSIFGKMVYYSEGPKLPESECVDDTNLLLTEAPKEGCTVNTELLTATCKKAYDHPLY